MLSIILLDDGGAYAVEINPSTVKPYRTTRCGHLALGITLHVGLPPGIENAAIYKSGSPGVKILRELFESHTPTTPPYPCRACAMGEEIRQRYQMETGYHRAPVCGPGTHCGRMSINLDAGYIAWHDGGYRDVKEGTYTRSFGPKLTTCDTCGGDLTKR